MSYRVFVLCLSAILIAVVLLLIDSRLEQLVDAQNHSLDYEAGYILCLQETGDDSLCHLEQDAPHVYNWYWEK